MVEEENRLDEYDDPVGPDGIGMEGRLAIGTGPDIFAVDVFCYLERLVWDVKGCSTSFSESCKPFVLFDSSRERLEE